MREARTIRRGSQRSASRPTRGATAPSSKSDSAAAPESAPRLQPNSASIGPDIDAERRAQPGDGEHAERESPEDDPRRVHPRGAIHTDSEGLQEERDSERRCDRPGGHATGPIDRTSADDFGRRLAPQDDLITVSVEHDGVAFGELVL